MSAKLKLYNNFVELVGEIENEKEGLKLSIQKWTWAQEHPHSTSLTHWTNCGLCVYNLQECKICLIGRDMGFGKNIEANNGCELTPFEGIHDYDTTEKAVKDMLDYLKDLYRRTYGEEYDG